MSLEDPYEGQKFSSFEELKKYLEEYGQKHFVKFWIRSSHTINSLKTKSPKKINPDLKYVCMKFACIFGGEKIRFRGSGIRKSTTYRNLGCPCMINAVVGEDGNHVKLETVVLDHNHALCKTLYDSVKNLKSKFRMLQNEIKMNKSFLLKKSVSEEIESSARDMNDCDLRQKDTNNDNILIEPQKNADVTIQEETYENDVVIDSPSTEIQNYFKRIGEKYGSNVKIIVVNRDEDEKSLKNFKLKSGSSLLNVELNEEGEEENEESVNVKKEDDDGYEHLRFAAEEKICRLCLSTSNKVSPIFKPSLPLESTVLSFKIMGCASIEVSDNDDLPCNICTICEEILEIAYNFRVRCENSDTVLRKIYSSNRLIDLNELSISSQNDRTCSKKNSAEDKLEEEKEPLEQNDENVRDIKIENRSVSVSKSVNNGSNIEQYGKLEEICPICGLAFDYYTDLMQHMKEHSDIENLILTCNFCSVIFTTVKSLLEHMNEHLVDVNSEWSNKLFGCSQCESMFLTLEEAMAHEATHVEGKSTESSSVGVQTDKNSSNNGYLCNICGKILKSKDRFQSHRNMHEGLRPHICLECGRGFADRTNMHQHYDIVHLRKAEHGCPICHKKFYAPTKMKSHLTMHYGVKPFSCDVCNKTFRLRMNMVKHKKTHSNERPHKCDKCSAAFTERNSLMRHSYVHGGVRPYACPLCGHRFTLRFNLKKHMARGKCTEKARLKDADSEYVDDWDAIASAQPDECLAEVKGVVKCETMEQTDFPAENESIRIDMLQEYEEKQ